LTKRGAQLGGKKPEAGQGVNRPSTINPKWKEGGASVGELGSLQSNDGKVDGPRGLPTNQTAPWSKGPKSKKGKVAKKGGLQRVVKKEKKLKWGLWGGGGVVGGGGRFGGCEVGGGGGGGWGRRTTISLKTPWNGMGVSWIFLHESFGWRYNELRA